MTQLMIDLSDDMDAKLRTRAAEAGYADLREYVQAIVAADALRIDTFDLNVPSHLTFNSKAQLKAMLLEGHTSGPAEQITPAEWAMKRQQLTERHTRPERS